MSRVWGQTQQQQKTVNTGVRDFRCNDGCRTCRETFRLVTPRREHEKGGENPFGGGNPFAGGGNPFGDGGDLELD